MDRPCSLHNLRNSLHTYYAGLLFTVSARYGKNHINECISFIHQFRFHVCIIMSKISLNNGKQSTNPNSIVRFGSCAYQYEYIVKLRERVGLRVDLGRSLKGHL